MRIISVLFATPLFLSAIACGDGGDNPEAAVGKSVEPLKLSQTLNGIQLTVTTSGPLIQGVNNTYTWTATNVSTGTFWGTSLSPCSCKAVKIDGSEVSAVPSGA